MYQSKQYDAAARIFYDIMESGKDNISDCKNFILCLYTLILQGIDINADYIKYVEHAHHIIHTSEYSDGYELHISDKVLQYIKAL
jgi:hypothetical protein